jgi:hypothetical protein
MLLAGIAQVSLGLLRDESEWKSRKGEIVGLSREYLRAHQHRFDLWDKKEPFGQVAAENEPRKQGGFGNCSTSIFLFKRTFYGNTPALHDHEARNPNREMADDEMARGLLSFQSFAPQGTFGRTNGCGGWSKDTVISLSAAPLNNKLVVMLWGANLLDTIWLNLMTRDMFADESMLGKPFWELDFPDLRSAEDYSRTYFGWILPMCRAIHVHDYQRSSITEAAKYQRFSHPLLVKKPPEKKDKREFMEMADNPDWFVWRELGAAQAILKKEPCLNSLSPLFRMDKYVADSGKPAKVLAGGFVAKQAKISSPMESILRVKPREKGGEGFMSAFRNCLDIADGFAARLMKGQDAFIKALALRNIKKPGSMNLLDAKTCFWWKLNQHQDLLVDTVNASNKKESQSKWEELCRAKMMAAFDETFGTCLRGRTYLAYAGGRSCLK